MINRIYWAMVAAVACLIGCGGYAEENAGDSEGELGTSEQAWAAYSTAAGTRWGVQQDTNNSQCSSGISANTACRFLTMQISSGSFHPTYLLAVQTNFTSPERTVIGNQLNIIITGLNAQTGFPVPSPQPQVPGWVRQNDGAPVAIQIFKADFSSDGTLAFRNFVQVLHSSCRSSDLDEGNEQINGKFRECKNATIGIDLAAIDAAYGTLAVVRERFIRQSIMHGIHMAMGMGTASVANSYRNATVNASANPSAYLTPAELCMVRQFGDVPGSATDPGGVFFHGSFPGC